MRVAIAGLLCAAALAAGCSKESSESPAGPGETAKAPGPAAPAMLSAPRPKEGLWSVTMAMDSGPGVNISGDMCLDAETRDAGLTASPRQGEAGDCDETRLTPQAGGVAFATTCRSDGRTVSISGLAKGDFDSAYTVETVIRTDPPPAEGLGEVKTRIEARRLGDCRPGQVAGQMANIRMGR